MLTRRGVHFCAVLLAVQSASLSAACPAQPFAKPANLHEFVSWVGTSSEFSPYVSALRQHHIDAELMVSTPPGDLVNIGLPLGVASKLRGCTVNMLNSARSAPAPEPEGISWFTILMIFVCGCVFMGCQQEPNKQPEPRQRLTNTTSSEDEEKDRFRKTFNRIDTDGSGRLDRYEIARAMRACGMNKSDSEVRFFMQRCDSDGDGQIDFDEFWTAYKKGI